ncbi:TPA: hypothetical protein DD449_00140 [Candidatus Berkelbacteria bacterium]|uniref:Uncharacterized protein n=1 Tax=Berkelbacteria bacterium GW2011_GWE1_39_12 TaxID=1618337 RepID=A0A0G4B2P8_9BACT|nr:MAG: hypothetical protein UT28_C0001G0016 [Berkelbacteria bacterium GW2011_GWE1_39_12]HBO60083.1 hypothetical protein [Candidatus Berkelbacteria bacterium]
MERDLEYKRLGSEVVVLYRSRCVADRGFTMDDVISERFPDAICIKEFPDLTNSDITILLLDGSGRQEELHIDPPKEMESEGILDDLSDICSYIERKYHSVLLGGCVMSDSFHKVFGSKVAVKDFLLKRYPDRYNEVLTQL